MKKSVNLALLICAVLACAGMAQANEDEDVRKAATMRLSGQTRMSKLAIDDEDVAVQVQERRQLLSVNVGMVFPTTKIDLTDVGGGTEISVKSGITFGVRYLYQLTPEWGLGVEHGGYGYGDKELDACGGGCKIKNEASATITQAVVRYVLMPEKKTHYYVIGGLGSGKMSIAAKTKPVEGLMWWTDTHTYEWRDNWDTSVSGAVFSLGVGVEQNFSDTLVAELGIRWFNIGVKKTVDDKISNGRFNIANQRSIAITYSIGWKFGG